MKKLIITAALAMIAVTMQAQNAAVSRHIGGPSLIVTPGAKPILARRAAASAEIIGDRHGRVDGFALGEFMVRWNAATAVPMRNATYVQK